MEWNLKINCNWHCSHVRHKCRNSHCFICIWHLKNKCHQAQTDPNRIIFVIWRKIQSSIKCLNIQIHPNKTFSKQSQELDWNWRCAIENTEPKKGIVDNQTDMPIAQDRHKTECPVRIFNHAHAVCCGRALAVMWAPKAQCIFFIVGAYGPVSLSLSLNIYCESTTSQTIQS